MSYLCPFCDHGQFFKGQHSPKDPCTAYVDKLGAECGCVGQAGGIKAEPKGIVKAELRRAPTEEGGVVYTDDEPITE